MNSALDWIAAIGTMIAAALLAADLGRRVTGWGFVLFVAVSICWVVAALTAEEPSYPLATTNSILMAINAWGVWQYLLNPKKRREIERAEEIAEQAHEDVAKDEEEAPAPA